MDLRPVAGPALLALAVVAASCDRQDSPSQQLAERTAPASVRYEAHLSAGAMAPAGGILQNPYKDDRKVAEAGAALFSSMNCDGCHGGGGTGFVGPSLSDGRWRYGGAEDEIFQSIYYGRPQGMPAFGGLLEPDVIWTLVTYIQSLPVPANVPTQSWVTP
jgi:cytochrome c oxidase cbb3-type subunit 3